MEKLNGCGFCEFGWEGLKVKDGEFQKLEGGDMGELFD